MSTDSAAFSSSQGPSSATTGVIIPNKSTIAEEEIEVPFGRDESPTSSRPGSTEGMRISVISGSTANAMSQRHQSQDERLATRSPLDRLGQGGQSFGLGGFNAIGAGFLSSPRSEDEETGSDRRGGSEYYDKMSFGRASVASDVSGKGGRIRQVVIIFRRNEEFFTD
jgi:protein SPA2